MYGRKGQTRQRHHSISAKASRAHIEGLRADRDRYCELLVIALEDGDQEAIRRITCWLESIPVSIAAHEANIVQAEAARARRREMAMTEVGR